MNKKSVAPLIYSLEDAKNFKRQVLDTYNNAFIPLQFRDVLKHDVNSKLNGLIHSYDEDGSFDYSLFTSQRIAELNSNYRIGLDLENAVRNFYETKRFDTRFPVEDAISQFEVSGMSLQKPIHIQYDEGRLEVIASKPILQYMVVNCLKNTSSYAIDTKKIDVSVKDAGDSVVVSIADYGSTPLPPKETIERKKTGGRGQGIAMNSVQKLMEGYGGKMTHRYTDPILKQGTTFDLIFPKAPLFKKTPRQQPEDSLLKDNPKSSEQVLKKISLKSLIPSNVLFN